MAQFEGGVAPRVPVALFIFNRPDTTARVLEAIAAARPPKLLVVADGPRPHRPGEQALCAEARRIATAVTWECEVVTEFSAINMGCRRRVSSGLDWVFDTVDQAIVLEDDCVPHESFFPFCEQLLDRYRDDERVMMISGDNFQARRRESSYYYSRYTHIWGWATWRRAWRHYDETLARWPEFRDGGWLEQLLDTREARYWDAIFQAVYERRIDTWDYQWAFACWTQGALAVMPSVNLVSNHGFRSDATHTVGNSSLAALPVRPMEFPLSHPPFVVRDREADEYTRRMHFRHPSQLYRLARLFKHAGAALRRHRTNG